MSERTYHAALSTLGPEMIASATRVACQVLIQQCSHVATCGRPDSAADLAETIGTLDILLQQLRLIAGPALVDLARIDRLARLQGELRELS